jgi:hypothetical protein
MCVQVTKTANRFEISSLLEKILLKQVMWCLTFVGLYILIVLWLYCGWTSNYQKMVWDPINRFNCSILLCLSEARTWISNATCYDLFVFSGLRWKVVDIGGIADQHCFKFLFIILSIYTIRQKLSTSWLVSIISFLIRNLFQKAQKYWTVKPINGIPNHFLIIGCPSTIQI